jgi:hypothetical protein
MMFGIFIFPFLLFVIIFSIVKFREKALFILGLATVLELFLQYAARLSPNSAVIYYSLLFPYLILITVVSFYKLFRSPKTKELPKGV